MDRTRLGDVEIAVSTRVEGDFHLDRVAPTVLERRRRALVDLPWTMLDERHGVEVVAVAEPGAGDREVGDVAACTAAGAVVGIWVGDCAPVVLVSDSGAFVAAHAGWRGIADGVLDVAVRAAFATAAPDTWRRAWVGPHIGPCCYEFGGRDLDSVADAVGDDSRSVAVEGGPAGPLALDVGRAIELRLGREGIGVDDTATCTGCDRRFFSHRRRREAQRHVVAAWRPVSTEEKAA